jgi:hypothetical protein
MSDIATLVVGSEKLTRILGVGPLFTTLKFMKCISSEARQRHKLREFPRLTATIHLWTSTKEVDERGYYILSNHTLATIRFLEIEDLKMEDFNHQNVIFGLEIRQETRDQGPSPFFAVDFDPSHGVDATLMCQRIEVLSAVTFEV